MQSGFETQAGNLFQWRVEDQRQASVNAVKPVSTLYTVKNTNSSPLLPLTPLSESDYGVGLVSRVHSR